MPGEEEITTQILVLWCQLLPQPLRAGGRGRKIPGLERGWEGRGVSGGPHVVVTLRSPAVNRQAVPAIAGPPQARLEGLAPPSPRPMEITRGAAQPTLVLCPRKLHGELIRTWGKSPVTFRGSQPPSWRGRSRCELTAPRFHFFFKFLPFKGKMSGYRSPHE